MGLYDAPSINKYKVGTFKGIDVSVPEDQQQPYRAADALNMIPDASGEVRKRPGVQASGENLELIGTIIEVAPERIIITCNNEKHRKYNVYFMLDGWKRGMAVAERPTVVFYGDRTFVFMVNLELPNTDVKHPEHFEGEYSAAVAMIDKGQCILYTDQASKVTVVSKNNGYEWSETIIPVDDPYLTLPTTLIGCDADGGGTHHQQINLLNPWVTESFCVTATDGENTFHLQDQVRNAGTESKRYAGDGVIKFDFRVEILKEVEETDGNAKIKVLRWLKRDLVATDGYRDSSNRLFLSKEGNQKCYYIDGTTGKKSGDIDVNHSADYGNISPSPKPGEDNVRITHIRADFYEKFVELCKCVCGTTYGVGGYKDRLFLGGPGNTVYYSEMEDPFYIGALNYVHTEEGSKVMALDGTAGTLSILTDKGIVLLSGQASAAAEDSYVTNSTFVVSHTLPAPEPIGYNNTAILGGEIVYLSKEGVVAIASKDNYAERYAEYRSALIDRKMLKDKPQRILNFGRYLLIFCAGGICWLLDENQPNKDGNKPYAAHQYEGYRMDGFAADAVYIEGEALKLIRGDEIYRWTDGSLPEHYHDEKNTPIKAYWETPWIYGSNFYKNKIFMRLGVLLGELTDITTGQTVETNTGILAEGKKNDEDWKVFMNEEIVSRTFSFDRIDFRYLTFRGVAEMPAMTRKIKVKKAKRFKLRFSNNTVDQPFILREYGLDYVQED